MKEEPATLTSAGLETATQTVDRINSARNEGQVAAGRIAADRAKRDQQSLQVSANSLVNPPRATNLTPPVLETPPQTGTANAVSNDLGEIITAQTQEASDLRARRSEFTELGNLGTLGDFRTQQLADLGVPDNVRQLKDIQLQLADVDTASDLTKTRIQGAAGQTLAGGQREVTQEDRENAVRRSGLAAQASVLQGNIQTATTLVNQAVQTAYQDRSLKNSNLLNQINDLSGTVDNQTQQLLDQEKARVEADQAAVKEVKDSVALAMQSGAATPQEVAQLTDINATDADRLSLAQSISARGATEDRNLDVQQTEASIRASNAGTRSSNASAALNEKALLDQEKAVEEGVLTPEQSSLATELRKERNGLQEVKDAKDLEGGFVGLISALDQENGVGDISAINSFQRLAVDPGVAVREGDVALLQSAQSFGDQALLRAQGLMVGDKLTPEARTQMRTLSAQIYDSRVGFVEDNTAQLRTIAQENGIDYNKYVGKSFVDSATLLNNLNKVVFEVVKPTSTGITFEDGTEFVLPNN